MSNTQNPNPEIQTFLEQKRIAVAGVSRSKNEAANVIFRKLRDGGYQVFAVNPNAEGVEGTHSYEDLAQIPEGVDAVVIATHPKATLDVVQQCIDLGIRHVWMHRSFGQGSFSEEAAALARNNGIQIIPAGCPMMFCEPVDMGHQCMRWFLRLTGSLPRAA